MNRRILSLLTALALMMAGLAACTALADEYPQPEGGKKFESSWAIGGGLVQIYYEEEGYRVDLDIRNLGDGTGANWFYSCSYNEEKDALVSISSQRTNYTVSPDTGDKVIGETVYDDIDPEGQETEFTIDENGRLIWKDGREDAGAGLAFTDIGHLEGIWRNEAEEVEVEFMWNGIDPDTMFYTVYIQRGLNGADTYTLFLMNGDYDPAAKRVSAYGTATVFTKNASGGYDTEEDGENYDAFFTLQDDGRLLYETANGIELEYDIMGKQD